MSSDARCVLAADAKVETPEGGLTIKGLAAKPASVFTKENSKIRFRMLREVRLLGENQPVLAIKLDNGLSFRVGAAQVVFKKGMIESRADELQAGDELVPMFHYPEGYEFLDDRAGEKFASTESIRVVAVGPGGTADVYTFAVNQSGCFFVSAGVLCKAEN